MKRQCLMVNNSTNINKATLFLFQLRIAVKDGGTPSLSSTAILRVDVSRNLYRPEFRELSYETTIAETIPTDVSIVQINATDRDSKVIRLFKLYVFHKNSGNILCIKSTSFFKQYQTMKWDFFFFIIYFKMTDLF